MTVSFTIDELFTPALAGNGPSAPAPGTWFSQILANADTLTLPTTAWNAGDPERTILSIVSSLMSQEDGLVSLMAQGGFLDFCATGTVTFTGSDGVTVTQAVSPDPSDPNANPTGASTWLDVLANSVYNVQRIAAGYAVGAMVTANTSLSTPGPYVAGTYHVGNPSTGASYSNLGSVSIPPSSVAGTSILTASGTPTQITTSTAHGLVTGAVVYVQSPSAPIGVNQFFQVIVTGASSLTLIGSTAATWAAGGKLYTTQSDLFQSDIRGTIGSSLALTVTETVTSNTGVFTTNMAQFSGVSFESNVALAARCRLKLQALSPNGASGAYQYISLTAVQILAAQDPPITIDAINRVGVATDPLTGVVNVTVATASGVVHGNVNLEITGATTATPIQITTLSAGDLSNGDPVTISGVLGMPEANGDWTVSSVVGLTFTLDGSVGIGTYEGGGFVNGGTLGELYVLLQRTVVPDSVTATVTSATEFDVEIISVVVLPAAYAARYHTAAVAAVAAFVTSQPIGGTDGVIYRNDVIGVLWAAGSFNGQPSIVRNVQSVTLAGGSLDVDGNLIFPTPQSVAVPNPTPVVTVNGV